MLDTGLIVVIGAVLLFYLRLIILQREQVKRTRQEQIQAHSKKSKTPAKKAKGGAEAPAAKGSMGRQEMERRFGLLSPKPLNRVIAGIGAVLILVGALLYAGVIPLPALQAYWWAPTAAGILAFSAGFGING
jgi:Flp pilus assembly protein TadB